MTFESFAEQQLMGWRLAIAPSGSNTWSTLAEASAPASSVDGRLTLATLDPRTLANGAWHLRVTAWDLSGRSSEVNANIIVDSAVKRFDAQVANDAMITLDGHTLAVNRLIAQQMARLKTTADFGNWQMPLLATRLTTDQPATLDSGATAAWREGARVWLSVPAALDVAGAGLANLSFTLATTALPLGNEPGAPQVWRPVFNSDQGWQLEAHASDDADGVVTQEALVRQGGSLFNQTDGMPWLPVANTCRAAPRLTPKPAGLNGRRASTSTATTPRRSASSPRGPRPTARRSSNPPSVAT